MNIIYLLVFYSLNITTGYEDKEHTIPQFVSGPYDTEAVCTEHQTKDIPPQVPENGVLRLFECIAVSKDDYTGTQIL